MRATILSSGVKVTLPPRRSAPMQPEPEIERIDHGATGAAMAARPSRELETIKAGVTVKLMTDACLADRMARAGQLSDRQHAVALRLVELFEASRLEPRVCGAYAPRGWANGNDDETEENPAVAKFRRALQQSAAPDALHDLCLGRHPGFRFLRAAQHGLDRLAVLWGIEQ